MLKKTNKAICMGLLSILLYLPINTILKNTFSDEKVIKHKDDPALIIGKPTHELMERSHAAIDSIAANGGGIIRASKYVSDVVWKTYRYDYRRALNLECIPVDWYKPYRERIEKNLINQRRIEEYVDFYWSLQEKPYPELGEMLINGQSICLEKAIFVAHALREDPLFKDYQIYLMELGINSNITYKNSEGINIEQKKEETQFARHKSVLLIGPSGVYVIDGQAIPLKNYLNKIEEIEYTYYSSQQQDEITVKSRTRRYSINFEFVPKLEYLATSKE